MKTVQSIEVVQKEDTLISSNQRLCTYSLFFSLSVSGSVCWSLSLKTLCKYLNSLRALYDFLKIKRRSFCNVSAESKNTVTGTAAYYKWAYSPFCDNIFYDLNLIHLLKINLKGDSMLIGHLNQMSISSFTLLLLGFQVVQIRKVSLTWKIWIPLDFIKKLILPKIII